MRRILREGDDSDTFIHPRKYIRDCGFKEDDWVEIWVKDRQNPLPDEDANDWYQKAFGSQRNLMKVIFKYDPENDQDKRRAGMEIKFFFTYNMAPELEDEFDKTQFQYQMKEEKV